MSKAINQTYQSWKIVEQSVRRHTFMYQNRKLSSRDNLLVQDCVVLLAMVWCECFTPSSFSENIPRWIPRWLKTIESIPWNICVRFFKSCDDLFLSLFLGGEDHIITDYDDFKRHLRGEFEFAGDLLSPARDVIDSFLHCHGEGAAFLLHQAFAFPSRTSLKDIQELQWEMIEKFESNCVRVMEFNHNYSEDAEVEIIRHWFQEKPDTNYFICRHGTGAVAEPKVHSIEKKYLQPGPDQLMQYVIRTRDLALEWPFSEETLKRVAKVQLVPKNSTSFRTITMEPACLMYMQQGVRSLLVRYIQRHPQLSKHIDLACQDKSRQLCRESSVDGEYVTIDLSMASDSINMNLFRAWFRDTWLYPLCIASRSTVVHLLGKYAMKLPFYAGMGNATTFPIQCIVYSAICEAAIAEVGSRPGEIPFRVYGDDIIIHRRYAAEVMRRLTNYGFLINKDKSYYSTSKYGIFRESCGEESLNGNDIKPVRIPRNFSSYRTEYIINVCESYGNVISLANAFLEKHLYLPYLWLVRQLNALPTCIRPLFGTDDGCLHTEYVCSNHNLQILWSDDYFSSIAVHGIVRPVRRRKKKKTGREDIRLFESLRQMAYRDASLDVMSSFDPVLDGGPITIQRTNPLALETTETILSSR